MRIGLRTRKKCDGGDLAQNLSLHRLHVREQHLSLRELALGIQSELADLGCCCDVTPIGATKLPLDCVGLL